MKIHLSDLELFVGDDGKTKYRHKRKRNLPLDRIKAVCGKNDSSYTVEIPDWYEYVGAKSTNLCQHCVQSLNKKKQALA